MLDLFCKVHSYGMCNKLNLKKKLGQIMYLFSIKDSYFNIILVFTPIESTSVEKVSIKKLHLIDELKIYLPVVINRFLEFMKCTLKNEDREQIRSRCYPCLFR